MGDASPRRVLELPWRTLLKILLVGALVWLFLRLRYIVLLFVVSSILAVALDPVVNWLERRRIPRTGAIIVVSIAILALVTGFVVLTWTTLTNQWRDLAGQLRGLHDRVVTYLPYWTAERSADAGGGMTALQSYAFTFARSTSSAIAYVVFGFVLTIYLLLDGSRTYRWLVAFFPARLRPRAERTAFECKDVIFGYVAGNVITSVIATICTFVALALLDVPAALLLAILAGLSDFVPVIGFIASAIPAVLLALTVSPATAAIVVVFYIVYNAVENYFLSPWAYGNRLQMSDTAVILAFAAGAELGGVIGALIALPIAALYPTIERLWMRGALPDETVRDHRELETRPAS